ncbi:zinc finger domain-containing protein [Streptomyces lavendulocolor]
MYKLEEREQAHRTLTRFLAELYPRRDVRAAAGRSGTWLNSFPPELSVPVAGMDLDRPVAVHLALHLRSREGRRFLFVTFDCDAKKVGAAQAAADAALLADAAKAEDIEPVPAASGSPGGRHVWTGCAEGVAPAVVRRINAAAARLCPSLDKSPLGNPQEGLVRPPGAAHRNGGYSTLTAHTIEEAVKALGTGSAPAEAFERLAVRLEAMAAALPIEISGRQTPGGTGPTATGHGGRTVPPSIAQRGPRLRHIVEDTHGCPKLDTPWRPLGERAMRALRRSLSARHDHSNYPHAVARSMALAGWTRAEGLAVVRDAASSPALEWLRTERQPDGSRCPRDKDETARLWARVWWLAVEDAARMPRRPEDDGRPAATDEVQQAVTDLFARMRAAGPARWSRESGPADAAILSALAWLMLLAGTTDVSANVRRLGVLGGYTAQTASLALWRLIRDGWITVTADAERRAGKARRVTLATSHECTDHHRHKCAIDKAPDDVSPVHPGSDRSGTPAPPPPPTPSLESLRALLAHQQADVWHHLGHHAARTLWSIRQLNRPRLADLMADTGYGRRATLRHLHRLQALQLVTTGPGRRGETTYAVTSRSLYEAAQETGTADRIAGMATTARVDQAVHEWWAAEEIHRSLPFAQRPRRTAAEQTVIPGMDPRGREYPRDENGRPDHARAHEIEAQRIGAPGILAHAQQLARTGELIDPAHLSGTGAQQPKRPAGRRAVIPSRSHCPHCQAAPGQRCTTAGTGRPAARWHAARRAAQAHVVQEDTATHG